MSNARGRYLGDAAFEPVLAELARRTAVVFLHPTSPPGWESTALGQPRAMIEYLFDTARTVTDLMMSRALERHPDLSMIVPHCGGVLPVLADRVNEFRRLFLGPDEEGSSDAATQLRHLYYDLAGTAFPRQVPALLSLADAHRLLFGSDYYWTPPPAVAAHLAAIDADRRRNLALTDHGQRAATPSRARRQLSGAGCQARCTLKSWPRTGDHAVGVDGHDC